MEIKWNQKLFGVEIKDDANHFVINAQPSMVMNWHDAVRYFKDNKVWQLPTRKQLLLFAKYIDEINALNKANGGYEVSELHWTADEDDKLCACYVDMDYCYTDFDFKFNNYYVRAVSTL